MNFNAKSMIFVVGSNYKVYSPQMIKRNTLLFVFMLAGLRLALGQTITISSRVVDRDSQEPLTFASVGIRNRPIGTITNLQGEFDFHIPIQYRNDILVISMLGYENFEAPVWSLVESKPPNIEMKKSATLLDEVVITDSLSGGDILHIALSRIEENYPMQPFMLEGFYRDVKKVGGTYVSLLEAAVRIYDENYKAPRNKSKLRERVALREVRRSLGYSNKFTSFFDEGNLLEELLLYNTIRYRLFPKEEIFFESLQRINDSYYNGHAIFVVSLTGSYSLKLYIDKDSYAIIHMEYENLNQQEIRGKRKGLTSRFVYLKQSIDFKYYEGKYFLNFLAVDSKVNWYNIKTDELEFETELRQNLLINQVEPATTERIGTTEKMKNYGLQYQDQPYNKTFWENYNVIKESPLDRQVIKDLERELPLDRQFQNN